MNTEQTTRCATLLKELCEITDAPIEEALMCMEGTVFSDEECHDIFETITILDGK